MRSATLRCQQHNVRWQFSVFVWRTNGEILSSLIRFAVAESEPQTAAWDCKPASVLYKMSWRAQS